ncbi:MAG: LysR family transcriptional regulator [Anaerovoracaceae bacterium]
MNNYIRANEIVEVMGISQAKAYKLIRQLNEELREAGYITVSGRVSRRYFEERIYGFDRKEVI